MHGLYVWFLYNSAITLKFLLFEKLNTLADWTGINGAFLSQVAAQNSGETTKIEWLAQLDLNNRSRNRFLLNAGVI